MGSGGFCGQQLYRKYGRLEQIAGLNCMNVTLVLDGEEFSNLAGKELDFSAICSEQRGDTPDVEASYAHCDIRIAFP